METFTQVRAADAPAQVRQARRGLLIFGSLLLPLSLLGYWFYAASESFGLPLGKDLPLKLSPALAAVITRLVLHEGFKDVSFRFSGIRAILLGLLVPLLVGSLAYGGAYLTGLAQFVPPALPFIPASAGPLANFAVMIALVGMLGTLVLLPSNAGEEIGWRGYLLPRLIDAGVPQPILLSGLIWGAWHLVPLFTSGYAAGPFLLLSAITLMVAITSFSYILSWMRLDTGSIWPCIIAHAAWNAIINGGFDLATRGEAAKLWTGESGLLVVAALVILTLLIGYARRRGTTLR